jgi:hypothetical protein
MSRIDPNHDETRALLRFLGPFVLAIGLVFTIAGFVSFFTAFNHTATTPPKMPELPSNFPMMPGGAFGPGEVTIEYPPGTTEEEKKAFDRAIKGESESDPSVPSNFWMAFIGLPLLVIGASMTRYGYMGAMARYVADEVAPVAADTVNYVVDETEDSITTVAKAIGEGIRGGDAEEVRCASCGTENAPDARFCKSCAAPLRKHCESCGKDNDPDATYCNGCGQALE